MDYNQVKELIGIIEGTDFSSFSLSIDGVSVAIERGGANKAAVEGGVQPTVVQPVAVQPVAVQPVAQPTAQPEEPAAEELEGQVVTCPIVGTFYASPTPEQPPFVSVGDTVKKGDVLCIVEAMKFMNEITSEYDGTVLKVMAEDQQMVEYGQPLFLISAK